MADELGERKALKHLNRMLLSSCLVWFDFSVVAVLRFFFKQYGKLCPNVPASFIFKTAFQKVIFNM